MTERLPDELEIPDSIEPVIAWKTLIVGADGLLYSPSRGMSWWPKKRAEASCTIAWDYGWEAVRGEVTLPENPENQEVGVYYTPRGPIPTYHTHSNKPMPQVQLPDGLNWSWEPHPHQIVGDECACGIYAVDNPEACLQYGTGSKRVICKIALWGRVVQGTSGARAQYAYPQSIEFASSLANHELVALAEQYGLTLPDSVPDTMAITNPSVTPVFVPFVVPANTSSSFKWVPVGQVSLGEDDGGGDFAKEIITITAIGVALGLLFTIMFLGETAVLRLCAAFAVLAGAIAITSWASKKNA